MSCCLPSQLVSCCRFELRKMFKMLLISVLSQHIQTVPFGNSLALRLDWKAGEPGGHACVSRFQSQRNTLWVHRGRLVEGKPGRITIKGKFNVRAAYRKGRLAFIFEMERPGTRSENSAVLLALRAAHETSSGALFSLREGSGLGKDAKLIVEVQKTKDHRSLQETNREVCICWTSGERKMKCDR
jgi:hypothetical protein